MFVHITDISTQWGKSSSVEEIILITLLLIDQNYQASLLCDCSEEITNAFKVWNAVISAIFHYYFIVCLFYLPYLLQAYFCDSLRNNFNLIIVTKNAANQNIFHKL